MNYWLDLFTGTTWQEFRDSGATVSGFRARQRKIAQRIKSNDILLCYLTGVMRWVGALEVVGPSADKRRIWQSDEYPIRFDVKPLVILEPEHGVPMDQLEGRVVFFAAPKDRGRFRGFVRRALICSRIHVMLNLSLSCSGKLDRTRFHVLSTLRSSPDSPCTK